MWVLVGLGNPGAKYEGNRHNVGFHVVDAIADEYGIGPFKSKFSAQMAEGRIGDQKVVLLKPQTYMNESGRAVGQTLKFFKGTKARTVVFHDELDLAPGKMRVKVGGGVAGHNGLKSIRAHLSSADFRRVRIGIGHPGDKSRVSGFVLSDFSKAEKPMIEDMVSALARRLEVLLTEGDELYMTRVSEALPK
ncbi:MAG: aminoacyl-tRNA hydrolase [Micavibrio sp.]|nr:aminoacyl-tRNA hydrolase [Micavibrio sp.]